ncbi:hypothetical protein [Haloarcula amylovorans]|uniref:hypothetical protein n=1 Tax=Haloarcula amylovorans TaxID=2562280 RepID=UPI00142FF7BF|nr:hypothetical protein [Halomicroarcula amylolytica]
MPSSDPVTDAVKWTAFSLALGICLSLIGGTVGIAIATVVVLFCVFYAALRPTPSVYER